MTITHPLEVHTLRQIRELGVPTAGGLLIAGVSGGVDSVALLHLLAAVAGELKFGLCAVYVDHGLRPDESAAEAELVERLAAQLGAVFRAGRVAVREYAEERGLSIEAAARTLRYRFLEETAGELGAAAIVVAHTADDQAEEVLLRLIRGTGRGGLAGMAPLNYRRVIRPLLGVTKARLLDYLRERNIPFLEDSSNAERDFLRNRVRLELLPYLEKHFNPAIRLNLLRTAEILRSEEDLLDDLSGELYRRTVSAPEEAEILRVDSGMLATGHQALQRRVVEMVLVELGVQPSFQHIDKLLELAAKEGAGGELHLPEGLRVVKRGPFLEFSYPAGRNRHRAGLAKCGELSYEKVIEGVGLWPIEELGLTLLVEVLAKAPRPGELIQAEADYLDMAELSFPFTVRAPRPGDCFHPLGGPGSRKVADFLSDRKVAREKRGRVPVLTCGRE
ncbi:MAG: tRNA lysidine(34) synthetase TilS, partial [Desulfurivibrionaceae bacterium]